MRMYRLDEAEFHLPEQAQDQSLNLFAYTLPDPLAPSPAPLAAGALPEFSLVISRSQVSAVQPLGAYVTQQLQMLEQSLADYTLVQRGEAFVDGLVAMTAEFTWVSEQGAMHQRQAYMFCPAVNGDRDAPRVALTLTATSLEKVQAQYAFTFEQILYSFSFRR